MSAPLLAPIPPVCTVADVCAILRISRAHFYRLQPRLREMGVLREVVPQLDTRLRYQGAPIARFLSAEGQAEQMRALLRRAR